MPKVDCSLHSRLHRAASLLDSSGPNVKGMALVYFCQPLVMATGEFLGLYKRYAQQLTVGCGSKACTNVGYCATNRLLKNGLEAAMDVSFAHSMAVLLAADTG